MPLLEGRADMDRERRRRGASRARPLIAGGVAATAIGALLFFATQPHPEAPPGSSQPNALAVPEGQGSAAPTVTPDAGASTPSPRSSSPTSSGNPAPAPGTGKAVEKPAVDPPPPEVRQEDLPPGHPPVSSPEGTQVSIQWLGHACFYIHSPGSSAVVTDPFDAVALGLSPPSTGAHLVTVSSDGPAHSFTSAVRPFQGDTQEVVRGKPAQRGDLRLAPLLAGKSGAGGENVAYVIEAGPLRIAHLGDLRGPLDDAALRALGSIDILMIPAGGEGLSPRSAAEVCRKINPRIVLPMAYRPVGMDAGAPGLVGKLSPVEEFIKASPYAVTRKDTDIILLSKRDLPSGTEIFLLQYRQ
jgi:hypothetical protein